MKKRHILRSGQLQQSSFKISPLNLLHAQYPSSGLSTQSVSYKASKVLPAHTSCG